MSNKESLRPEFKKWVRGWEQIYQADAEHWTIEEKIRFFDQFTAAKLEWERVYNIRKPKGNS